MRLALWMVIGSATLGCAEAPDPPLAGEFRDDFERSALGAAYRQTGGGYWVVGGTLNARGARNHPLWLRRRLPADAVVELSVWANDPRGDLKVELFGDGRSFDPDGGGYRASGYVFVMGGWGNRRSLIARHDEHGAAGRDLVERHDVKVEPGRRYRWRIERRGDTIDWRVDGEAFLQFKDPNPLMGSEHAYFAVNNWESDTYVDDLVIRAP